MPRLFRQGNGKNPIARSVKRSRMETRKRKTGKGVGMSDIEPDLITEIKSAETAITKYAKFYHSKENECPADFKLLMLINGWTNPFIALNELLKRIDADEILLKRREKESGIKTGYKSIYKRARAFLQEQVNKHE